MEVNLKNKMVADFRSYVSPDKADFFQKYGLDFVSGKREGCYLWDIDGHKKLFNAHCNGGVFNLGHRSSDIISVLKQALDRWDIGNHHLLSAQRAKLAKRLADSFPGDIQYTVFGVGGGEAMDLAIKLARGYTGRSKIVSAKGGYHGHTGLALAAGDEKYRKSFGPQPPGFVQIPFGDLRLLEEALDEDTAAVIYETIPATQGILIPPDGFFSDVRQLCDKKGVQLIIDEVQTGLGRTGKLWGFEHFSGGSNGDMVPDIVVIGKGLSGGIYPITATCFRPHLQKVFNDDPFIHISTFGGAELGCAVALKVLELSSQAEFLQHVNDLAKLFRERMDNLVERHNHFIIAFRQLGLMMGIKMKNDMCGPLLMKTAYDKDLLLVYAGNDTSVCQFLPPLVMTFEQVDEVMEKLEAAVKKATILLPALQVKEGVSSAWDKVKKLLSGEEKHGG